MLAGSRRFLVITTMLLVALGFAWQQDRRSERRFPALAPSRTLGTPTPGGSGQKDNGAEATTDGRPVAVARRIGEGLVIATTVHEYPARSFLSVFGAERGETLF